MEVVDRKTLCSFTGFSIDELLIAQHSCCVAESSDLGLAVIAEVKRC